jgi:endonuclease/exonuclease/phosphatase family metal-dependent hydrolase
VTREFALTGVLTNTAACVGPLDDALGRIEQALPALTQACGFPYRVVFDPAARRTPRALPCLPGRGTDEELILTRYEVRSWELLPLYSPVAPFFFRHVLHARINHPVGGRDGLDVFTTHLDGPFDTAPCGFQLLPIPGLFPACPAQCQGKVCAGRECSVRECQAKQAADFVARHTGSKPAILAGDFNATPDTEPPLLESTYQEFTGRGWRDSQLAARPEAECDPASGTNCTAGRDAPQGDLEQSAPNVHERIDYIFVVPSAQCTIQEQGTGLFADQPNPFEKNCGPHGPICWASDHNGTRAELSCER